MVTIREVAKEAGVSIATVSFYLNGKPVSEEKCLRIEEAVRNLNYVVRSGARDLRVKHNDEIGILFPNVADPYYEKVISSIKGYLSYQGRAFSFSLSDDDAQSETDTLLRLIGRNCAGIILCTCQPENTDIFRLLEASGIPFALIDRKPDALDCNFVGCDNRALFYQLTRKWATREPTGIHLISGPLAFDDNRAAFDGFAAALTEFGVECTSKYALPVTPTRENGFRAGIRLLENGNRPRVILTTSYLLAEGLLYALRLYQVRVSEEVTIVTSGDSVDDVFYCNPYIHKAPKPAFELGETAARMLLQNIRAPQEFRKQSILLPCPTPSSSAKPREIVQARPPKEINVLILDDESTMYTLQRLMKDFHACDNTRVRFIGVHPAKMYDHIMGTLSRSGADTDVVLCDIPWLADFAGKDLLLPLDSFLKRYSVNIDQYVPGVFNATSRFNSHYYSLPYIATTQMLFYRRDLFHDERLRRLYEKAYGLPLATPKTWSDYLRTARFFTQAINPKSPVRYGHAMDMYNPSLTLCSLWPRLWASGGELYDDDGMLSLRTPAIIKAVRNLLDCVCAAHPYVTAHPVAAVEKLLSGEVAMACTFLNYATPIVDKFKASARAGKVGYARIPGGVPVMGGWSFAIPAKSRAPEAAFQFIRWASSADIAIPHAILGGQSPHLSTYRNYDMLSLYPWLSKAQTELSNARTRTASSGRARPRYLQERVESIIADELLALIRRMSSGETLSDADIEAALRNAETLVQRAQACRL
ncbi:MAG: extracellular solute-binding protein [Oscillospiraceae bacterium]|nr:extracellular solute-binding protein [Oscillospiraceae bacterium]